MKKLIVLVILVLSLGCESARETDGEFVRINTRLSYDSNTKIIYYTIYYSGGNSFLTPYLSNNGRVCRWENGIIEVK